MIIINIMVSNISIKQKDCNPAIGLPQWKTDKKIEEKIWRDTFARLRPVNKHFWQQRYPAVSWRQIKFHDILKASHQANTIYLHLKQGATGRGREIGQVWMFRQIDCQAFLTR